jgi:uncharacterized protein (DUF342 family)
MSELVPTFIIETILSDDELKISLRATARIVSKSNCKDITSEAIHQLLEQRGFARYRINQDQVDEIVNALSEAVEKIVDENDTKEFVVESDAVAQAINATAEIQINDTKLEAKLSINSSEGGQDLTLKEAEALLEEIDVTYGIDSSKIEELLEVARKAPPGETVSAQVAFALMPVAGEDADFLPLVDTANERILKPRLREDGSVDMLDLGDMPTVKIGAKLLRKVPLTEGIKGINVNRVSLPSQPGKDFDFKPGKGTEVSEKDEMLLIATISGQPNLLPRGMKVDDAIEVKAVDLSTGNIKTDANLIVKGDISEGMEVQCEGDITVGGVIESADVIAKGNIIVGKGILGRTAEHANSAAQLSVSIKAGGTIYAMFASYARLSADGDILIAEQLLHCDTTTKSKIIVGNDKTVGSQIVGGMTRSSESIQTDILGASAGVLTNLDLSGPFKVKGYELSCNRSIIDGKSVMLSNMRNVYSQLLTLPLTDARKAHLDKIKNTINFLENEIQELNDRGELLNEESEEICSHLRVIAKRKIQPNVVLKIAQSKFKSTRAREAGELYYAEREIHYTPVVKS